MKRTRRDLLRVATVLPFASGCLVRRPESRLLRSGLPLPKPFEVPLPVPPVLRPNGSFEITVKESAARILPGLQTPILGYNGTFPGPTIEAQRGQPLSLRLINNLPVPIVNHLHGGHTPPASDGYPTDLILPSANFPVAHMPDARAKTSVGERTYLYPNNQRAATLWYHDHRMDHTAPQVYRGLAGFYILRDEAEQKLSLPQGDKEIPLMICDRSFNADGSFLYPAMQEEYMGGVLGDVILVNGAPWPQLDVAAVKYRFRILNASNARRYDLALDPPSAFVQIGSDGGLLAAPVRQRSLRIAPAERFDVVIDFSRYKAGSNVTMVNQGEPVMRFRVVRSERDDSHIPERLSDDVPPPDSRNATVTRTLNFSWRQGMKSWTINGKPFDPARMDASPNLGTTEVWQLQTDFNHPLHLHLVHFQILGHSGRPGPWDAGWKDTIDLGPGQVANILVKFSDYRGRYVFHCHNLEHEDMSMMGNFEVV